MYTLVKNKGLIGEAAFPVRYWEFIKYMLVEY